MSAGGDWIRRDINRQTSVEVAVDRAMRIAKREKRLNCQAVMDVLLRWDSIIRDNEEQKARSNQ